MKNFAKLTIFFSISFAVFIFGAILIGYISFWVSSARVIPADAVSGLDFAGVVWTAISIALYFSILFTLSYSVRRGIPIFLSIFCIACLAFAFTAGSSLGASRLEALGSALPPGASIKGNQGLILTRLDNSIILLKESSETLGPRLVSIPGQHFIYQELPIGPDNTIPSLPPLNLGDAPPWFIRSVGIDFSLSALTFKSHYEEHFLSFAVYIFALILVLSSLRFFQELSRWPLANIFLSAFIFRQVLSLEVFLNSAEINAMINSFLGGRIPQTFITPAVFTALAVLILLFTLLTVVARAAKSKRDWDD